MPRSVTLALIFLWAAFGFAQRSETVNPEIVSRDYVMSDRWRSGFPLPLLNDLNYQPLKISSGRILLWVVRSDFADTRNNRVKYSASPSSDPVANFGNLAITYFSTSSSTPSQAVVFYEGTFPRPLKTIDFGLAKTQFVGMKLYLDRNSQLTVTNFSEISQEAQGLYLVENGVVRCRFLNLNGRNEYISRIALEFSRNGRISTCPQELVSGNKLSFIQPQSLLMAFSGNEHIFKSRDFKLRREFESDGSYEVKYVNPESASRFILERLEMLALKYKYQPTGLIRDSAQLSKMQSAFPRWRFITDPEDVTWSNLGYALTIISRTGTVAGSQLLYASTPDLGNSASLEALLRDARR